MLTKEQARKLLEVARGSRLDTLLLVALTTGIRRGESFRSAGYIDFETGLLYVRRNVARMDGVGYIEKEPKSKAGRRKIVLPNVVLEALKEHREDSNRLGKSG